MKLGAEIVHFAESNSSGVVYAAHDCGVITCRQLCYDRRFPSVSGGVAAGLDLADLVGGDNSADDGRRPVVIKANQRSCAVMQLQCRISQGIGNAILGELRANRPNNYSFWCPLNHEASNHHIVTRLNQGARGDVSQTYDRAHRHCSRAPKLKQDIWGSTHWTSIYARRFL